jgi:hypothetical protein
MRKLFTVVAAAIVALALASSAASASALTGSFSIQFPKGHPASNAPCPAEAFCGVGTLAGYGAATITILDETYAEVEGSACLAHTRIESIDLLDGSGSLVIESAGTFCRPGGSGDSHASSSSYGFPGQWTLSFTVLAEESTGIFAKATGAGSESMHASGGIGVWHLSGLLALAG